MKTQLIKTTTLGLLLMSACSLTTADVGDDINSTIADLTYGGKINLDMRLRYEYNDRNPGTPVGRIPGPTTRDLSGLSLRSRLGFTSGVHYGFQAMAELEHLTALDDNNLQWLDAQAMDNQYLELNQLWLSYQYEDFGKAKLGRQVYTLDDHRFIGHVGWRQNIQTFDAITAKITPIEGLSLNPGYLQRVNRVNGTDFQMDTIILNASYTFDPLLKLTGFGYLVQFDPNVQLPRPLSSNTFGIRATGTYTYEDIKLTYAGSFANQSDNDASVNNVPARNTDYDNNYYAFDLTAAYEGFTLGGGIEVLEGDGTVGFSTPLATVHKFQGYADVFALNSLNGTLTQGLIDYYVKAGYKIPIGNGIPVNVIYHAFEMENADNYLGQEIDATIGYKLNKYVSFLAKYAYYDADTTTTPYGGFDKTVFTFDTTFKF